MRVGKAGSDSGIWWSMGAFIVAKRGTAVPFVVAWPFSWTLLAGMLMEG